MKRRTSRLLVSIEIVDEQLVEAIGGRIADGGKIGSRIGEFRVRFVLARNERSERKLPNRRVRPLRASLLRRARPWRPIIERCKRRICERLLPARARTLTLRPIWAVSHERRTFVDEPKLRERVELCVAFKGANTRSLQTLPRLPPGA